MACRRPIAKEDLLMTERKILISAIIPCFNYEAYVGEAIESVLSQNADDMEVLVVDDGSTDGSWNVIQRYNERITAIRTENRGAIAACLTGLEASSGQFVYFLDADDALCSGAIDVIRPHLKLDVSKVQFELQPIDRDGALIREPFPVLDPSLDSRALIDLIVLRGSYSTPPTSGNVCRRDLYSNCGDLGSYEQGIAIDGVSYLLAPFLGEVVSINMVLGKYRIHGNSHSGFLDMTTERLDRAINRFRDRLTHLKQLLAERGFGEGIVLHSDYAFVLDLQLMRTILVGKRPAPVLLESYLRALSREQGGLRRIALAGFAVLLFVLPVKLSGKLVRIRLNPFSFRKLKTRMKSIAAEGRSERNGRQLSS
jgi:glycosyltransferase involved in cell wall biosynthesis